MGGEEKKWKRRKEEERVSIATIVTGFLMCKLCGASGGEIN